MKNNYYNEIKNELINNEIYKKVKNCSKNRNELSTYYNVGKLLSEARKHYGNGIIKDYSIRLTRELGRGYSKRNLWLMLKFFEVKKKVQTVSAEFETAEINGVYSLLLAPPVFERVHPRVVFHQVVASYIHSPERC